MNGHVGAVELVSKLAGSQKVQAVTQSKIGILLINTGTPSGYSYWPIWHYLRQFLTDRRTIEASRFFWYPMLYFVILRTRPQKVGPLYKSIWNHDVDESPLRTISRKQAVNLQKRFDAEPELLPVKVEWAFRYGAPSIQEKVAELHAAGVDRLIVLPMYPQFSATTTASCCDEVFQALQGQRNQMAVHTVREYFRDPAYLDAIGNSIAQTMKENSDGFEVVIVSYHGIPLEYQEKGDPYGHQCHETTRLLQQHMGIQVPFVTSFQSRRGPNEWLKPYTDQLVVSLAKEGYCRILVIAPGFSSDCLETLEEVEIGLAAKFKQNGGKKFVYVPCLNDSEAGVTVVEKIVRKEIRGFL